LRKRNRLFLRRQLKPSANDAANDVPDIRFGMLGSDLDPLDR